MNTAPHRPPSANSALNEHRTSGPDLQIVSNWLEGLPPDRSTTNQASVAAAVQLAAAQNIQQTQNPVDDVVTATNTTVATRMDVDDLAANLNRPPRRRGPLIVPLEASGTTTSMHELVDTNGNIVEVVTENAPPIEAAEQLQVINDAVRIQSGDQEDGDEEGVGSASTIYSGPHHGNRDISSSGRMMLDNASSVPETYNIPELSTDRGTDFGGSDGVAMSCGTGSIGGGRMSQGPRSPFYSPGDNQRANHNSNNSPAGSINRPMHSRSNSLGYPRQSLAVSSATTMRQPGPTPSRFIQQLQSSRRGRGGRRGLHTRTMSQGSFGSPIRENSPTSGSVGGGGGSQENTPATRRGPASPLRRGRRKRAVSAIAPTHYNSSAVKEEEEEEDADNSIIPKRRRMSSQGPEAIDTILDSSSVNGASILKVSVRSTGMISQMDEEQVKDLAPRAYKAWKQLQ